MDVDNIWNNYRVCRNRIFCFEYFWHRRSGFYPDWFGSIIIVYTIVCQDDFFYCRVCDNDCKAIPAKMTLKNMEREK